jgi:hypothetical protein
LCHQTPSNCSAAFLRSQTRDKYRVLRPVFKRYGKALMKLIPQTLESAGAPRMHTAIVRSGPYYMQRWVGNFGLAEGWLTDFRVEQLIVSRCCWACCATRGCPRFLDKVLGSVQHQSPLTDQHLGTSFVGILSGPSYVPQTTKATITSHGFPSIVAPSLP